MRSERNVNGLPKSQDTAQAAAAPFPVSPTPSVSEGSGFTKGLVACDYCGRPAEKTTGRVVYPHLPKLAEKVIYRCVPCRAHVGCHPGTDQPLGRLANAGLRKAKMAAHDAFDPLWRGKPKAARGEAYGWLARELGVDRAECHIGMFDVVMCRRVVNACAALSLASGSNPHV